MLFPDCVYTRNITFVYLFRHLNGSYIGENVKVLYCVDKTCTSFYDILLYVILFCCSVSYCVSMWSMPSTESA